MKKNRTVEQTLYILGLAAIAVVAAGCVLMAVIPDEWYSWAVLPCLVHAATGYYCPGCGGTRAVHYMLQGNFLLSLYDHPFVLYGTALFICFMTSHTLERITGGRVKGMKYRNLYTYVAVGIILLNFVVKNIMRFVYGHDILL